MAGIGEHGNWEPPSRSPGSSPDRKGLAAGVRGARATAATSRTSAMLICAVCVLLCPACWPVMHIVGRPAAVLPSEDERLRWSLGGVRWEEEDLPGGGVAADGAATGYMAFETGLGRRADVQLGCMAIGAGGVSAVARFQVLGYPRGTPLAGRARVPDASVEVGASCRLMAAADFVAADAHLGASVSAPLGPVTPYVTYRCHACGTGEPGSNRFRQNMLFVGLHLPETDLEFAVEVYCGWPTEPSPPGAERVWRTWGLNVVWTSPF